MMNQKRITENPLAQEFDFRLLLQFAFPTIVMMVFMGLYTIVDTVFVSRFVNTDALSAMNIVCPVINLTVGLGTMLATGGSAIIAREMGEGREIRASQDFTWIICAGVGLGLLISLVGVLFIEPLIRGLGASRRLFPYCREYLMMILFFTPARFFSRISLLRQGVPALEWFYPLVREQPIFCWIIFLWFPYNWGSGGLHWGQGSGI